MRNYSHTNPSTIDQQQQRREQRTENREQSQKIPIEITKIIQSQLFPIVNVKE